MKKVKIGEPKIIAQSTTEPIMWGGYQIPSIRCDEGVLYVKFMGRMDNIESYGKDEEKDPVFLSRDGGETWERSDLNTWNNKAEKLPNGDRFELKFYPLIKDFDKNFTPSEDRKTLHGTYAYTVEELLPLLGDKLDKSFLAVRVKNGETEAHEEICNIKWDNMPVIFCNTQEPSFCRMNSGGNKFKFDKNNVMWLPVYSCCTDENGRLRSDRYCTHLLRSDDFGHNWEYVSTVVYDEKFTPESKRGVEGFNEATLEILDDESMIMIIRSGSMDFRYKDYTIPNCYFVRSIDKGKTWSEPRPFYDYGIHPQSVKMADGTIVLISGRPGVYIRVCEDKKGENWDDIIELLQVPEEEKYTAYFEYSCSNTDICVYDDKTLFVVYSDFTQNSPSGERAKTIIVQKITLG